MSLSKEECSKCWLPPEKGKTLCRRCSVVEYNEIKWVRYHTPSPDCKTFRSRINSNTYYSSVLPEECIQCCNFILENPTWLSPLKNFIINTPHDKLTRLFIKNIERKDALLEYISNLLAVFIGDVDMCRRILNALLNAFAGKEKWILEELVQRPTLYHMFLRDPLLIPYHLTEDFFGHFEEIDVWWPLWEKMPASTKRRIRFRCMQFKDELIEKTWAPNRVLAWCIDELDGAWLATASTYD